MARVLIYLGLILGSAFASSEWCTDMVQTNEDSKLVEMLEKEYRVKDNIVTDNCLQMLVGMNKFESTKFALEGILAGADA